MVPDRQEQLLEPQRYDWIDDLTQRENDGPPGDLHDTNDNLF